MPDDYETIHCDWRIPDELSGRIVLSRWGPICKGGFSHAKVGSRGRDTTQPAPEALYVQRAACVA